MAAWLSGALVALNILIALVLAGIIITRLVKSLRRLILEVTEEAAQLSGAAGEINSASQELSERTTEQAAAIEETAASMEEMAAMLGQTSQQSQKSLQISEQGHAQAQKGQQVIIRLADAMEEIHSSNQRLEDIVKLIEEITKRTRVINEIVFETRLLSFNASIEAARAGAHGKGFAVVAEEVGKLAAMSGKAADEIRTLLDSSNTEVSKVVRATQERVQVGKQVSSECEIAFSEMDRTLNEIGEAVRIIATAAKEQEGAISQTNKAMGEMDKVTQMNSHSAEKLAAQSRRMSEGAAGLNRSILDVRQLVVGDASGEAGNAHAPAPEPKRERSAQIEQLVEGKVLPFPGTRAEETADANATITRDDNRWNA